MNRRRFLSVLSAVAISVIAVTGCGLSAGQDPLDKNRLIGDAGDTGGRPDRVVAFGQTFTWKDGLSVKMSKPREFKPSPHANVSAAGGWTGKTFLVVTVKVVNHTGKVLDLNWFSATLPPGASMSAVSDKNNGIRGQPPTRLLDGREATWRLGYAVVNPDNLVIEVSPDIERQPVTFAPK